MADRRSTSKGDKALEWLLEGSGSPGEDRGERFQTVIETNNVVSETDSALVIMREKMEEMRLELEKKDEIIKGFSPAMDHLMKEVASSSTPVDSTIPVDPPAPTPASPPPAPSPAPVINEEFLKNHVEHLIEEKVKAKNIEIQHLAHAKATLEVEKKVLNTERQQFIDTIEKLQTKDVENKTQLAQLEAANNQLVEANKEITRLGEDKEKSQKEMDDLKKENEDFKKEAEDAKKALEVHRINAKASSDANADTTAELISQAREEAAKEAEDKFSKEYSEKQAELETRADEVEARTAKREAEIEELLKQNEEKMRMERADFEERQKRFEEIAASGVAGNRDQLDEKSVEKPVEKSENPESESSQSWQVLKQDHAAQITKLKEENEEKLKLLQQSWEKYESDLKDHLTQLHEQNLQQTKRDHDEVVSLLKQEHEENVSHLRSFHAEHVLHLEQTKEDVESGHLKDRTEERERLEAERDRLVDMMVASNTNLMKEQLVEQEKRHEADLEELKRLRKYEEQVMTYQEKATEQANQQLEQTKKFEEERGRYEEGLKLYEMELGKIKEENEKLVESQKALEAATGNEKDNIKWEKKEKELQWFKNEVEKMRMQMEKMQKGDENDLESGKERRETGLKHTTKLMLAAEKEEREAFYVSSEQETQEQKTQEQHQVQDSIQKTSTQKQEEKTYPKSSIPHPKSVPLDLISAQPEPAVVQIPAANHGWYQRSFPSSSQQPSGSGSDNNSARGKNSAPTRGRSPTVKTVVKPKPPIILRTPGEQGNTGAAIGSSSSSATPAEIAPTSIGNEVRNGLIQQSATATTSTASGRNITPSPKTRLKNAGLAALAGVRVAKTTKAAGAAPKSSSSTSTAVVKSSSAATTNAMANGATGVNKIVLDAGDVVNENQQVAREQQITGQQITEQQPIAGSQEQEVKEESKQEPKQESEQEPKPAPKKAMRKALTAVLAGVRSRNTTPQGKAPTTRKSITNVPPSTTATNKASRKSVVNKSGVGAKTMKLSSSSRENSKNSNSPGTTPPSSAKRTPRTTPRKSVSPRMSVIGSTGKTASPRMSVSSVSPRTAAQRKSSPRILSMEQKGNTVEQAQAQATAPPKTQTVKDPTTGGEFSEDSGIGKFLLTLQKDLQKVNAVSDANSKKIDLMARDMAEVKRASTPERVVEVVTQNVGKRIEQHQDDSVVEERGRGKNVDQESPSRTENHDLVPIDDDVEIPEDLFARLEAQADHPRIYQGQYREVERESGEWVLRKSESPERRPVDQQHDAAQQHHLPHGGHPDSVVKRVDIWEDEDGEAETERIIENLKTKNLSVPVGENNKDGDSTFVKPASKNVSGEVENRELNSDQNENPRQNVQQNDDQQNSENPINPENENNANDGANDDRDDRDDNSTMPSTTTKDDSPQPEDLNGAMLDLEEASEKLRKKMQYINLDKKGMLMEEVEKVNPYLVRDTYSGEGPEWDEFAREAFGEGW